METLQALSGVRAGGPNGAIAPPADRTSPAPRPETVVRAQPGAFTVALAFGEALRRRDVAGARAHLEPGARVLTAEGTEVSGPDEIARVLAQLTAPGLRLDLTPGRTIVQGDVALCTQSWRLRTAAEDPCFERASRADFVLRRSDAGWRIAVAAPWG